MEKRILKALGKVIDPEIHLNIVDLGLIYNIKVKNGNVVIVMTLTSPACPYGLIIRTEAREAVKRVKGVKHAVVKLTLIPPWNPEKISQEIRWQLGLN